MHPFCSCFCFCFVYMHLFHLMECFGPIISAFISFIFGIYVANQRENRVQNEHKMKCIFTKVCLLFLHKGKENPNHINFFSRWRGSYKDRTNIMTAKIVRGKFSSIVKCYHCFFCWPRVFHCFLLPPFLCISLFYLVLLWHASCLGQRPFFGFLFVQCVHSDSGPWLNDMLIELNNKELWVYLLVIKFNVFLGN